MYIIVINPIHLFLDFYVILNLVIDFSMFLWHLE